MRKTTILNADWLFRYHDGSESRLDLPHTWNALDGQDGGGDYWRGTCVYEKDFPMPARVENELVYLQFNGVNASARVILNGAVVMTHDGGYSTFRADVTDHLRDSNHLVVEVDNSKNDRVYPQKADFTFYGGIYRDVLLLTVSRDHFDLDHHGGSGIAVTPTVDGRTGRVNVKTWITGEGEVSVLLKDAKGNAVAAGSGTDCDLTIANVHLWDGIADPYLYTCEAVLTVDGKTVDAVSARFGVRSFHVDPQKGFFLNGRSYPLRGVCRHQDWKGIGNALHKEHHDTDMAIIREMGANTLRLAHY
ncbi:MAG: glycoside hydrolase family 2 protein, partial [Oscillospiraceae bacterium]|nr:glycoside hydrolase family 2 protein [Oscillospiraceae bacterium]